jgi:drug/metabolite transporter (DMT)-like permease
MSAVLALTASVMWGASDFVGGSSARRMSASQVLFLSQLLTLPVVVGIWLLAGGWNGSLSGVGWAAGAGAASMIGLASLYRALALGRMSVVAPISACGAAGPVLVGIVAGERIPAAAIGGIACVLVGIIASSTSGTGDDQREAATWVPLLLALTSAFAFGAVLICLADAGKSSPSTSLLVMRLTSVALVGAVAGRGCLHLPRSTIRPSLIAIGLLDLAANGCYALAGRDGQLTVIGVLGSLYPVVTVVLARQVHGERLGSTRGAGVLATLAGVVLLGAAQVGT